MSTKAYIGHCDGMVMVELGIDAREPILLPEHEAVALGEALIGAAAFVRGQKVRDDADKRAELEAIFKSPA